MKRVLVVDDQRVISDSLATILNMRGYEAHAAYCAEEAVIWCREHFLGSI
jgi:DNA-binding NtrC family response regulator